LQLGESVTAGPQLLQPKTTESQQLQTKTIESQLLQSETINPQFSKNIQASCKARLEIPKLTTVNLNSNTVNPSSIKQYNYQIYIGNNQSEVSDTDNSKTKSEADKKRFEL
jgi:hypothetical protein